jgi:hypothetical protein
MRIAWLVALTACGGVGGSTDIEGTLRMSDLTDLEITRLVGAASASEGFAAQGQLHQFDDPFAEDPCPTVIEDLAANTVTITGGCTNLDDLTIEGTAVITNPLGWGDNLEYDFTAASTYEFDDFAQVFGGTAGTRMAWDGVFTSGAQFSELDMDLTTDQLGVAVRSDLYLECDRTSCEHGESGLELVGVGGVRVSGTIGVAGQTATGSLTLSGVDTVRVTIANNCVEWELVGSDRGGRQGACQ